MHESRQSFRNLNARGSFTAVSLRLASAMALGLSSLVTAGATAYAADSDGDTVDDFADAFPCDSSAVGVAFAPAQGDHAMILIEDQWPNNGDLDFNDVSLSFNYIYRLNRDGDVVSLRATFNARAVGGILTNGLGLRLPVLRTSVASITRTIGNTGATTLQPFAGDTNLTVEVLSSLRSLFGNASGQINSRADLARQIGQGVELEITFSTPVELSSEDAPYDLFIFRSADPSLEIHAPGYRGTSRMDASRFGTFDDATTPTGRAFVNAQGLPFWLHIPTLVPHPREAAEITQMFPRLALYASSGGTQGADFYQNGVNLAFAYTDVDSAPAPTPVFLGPDHAPAVTACVDAFGLSVGSGQQRNQYIYGNTLAPNGDVIVTGYTASAFPGSTNQGGLDGFVARYESGTGAQIWVRQFGGPGNDIGRDVAVDASGNIFVSGDSTGVLNGFTNNGGSDAFLLRLDSGGNVVWTRTVGGAGNEYGAAVAVDPTGNVVLGGGSTTAALSGATGLANNTPNGYLAEFATGGSQIWLHQFSTDAGASSNFNYVLNLAIDPITGDVYVVGAERRYNVNGSALENQVLSRHSGTNGSLNWVDHIGGYGYRTSETDQRYGFASDVIVDELTGALYVSGQWNAGSSVTTWGDWTRPAGDFSADATLTAVSAGGAGQWSLSLRSGTSGNDIAESVVLSRTSGTLMLSGRTDGAMPGGVNLGGVDYFVTAVSLNTQAVLWMTQGGSVNNDEGNVARVLVTGDPNSGGQTGSLLVVGNQSGALGGPDAGVFATFLYSHNLLTGAFIGSTAVNAASWTTGAWSTCSALCGSGTQTRTVTCTQPGGMVVPNSYCQQAQPATSQSCTGTTCTYGWLAGNWSACSSLCGSGTQTRTADCVDQNSQVVASSNCDLAQQPSLSQSCSSFDGCTYSWTSGSWSTCSQTCGSGSQTRSVTCQRSDGTTVASSSCDAGSTPSTSQTCYGTSTCTGPTLGTCNGSGRTGPTDCTSYYTQALIGAANKAILGEISIITTSANTGFQRWTVPTGQGGTYRIIAHGAQGGHSIQGGGTGGLGAMAVGEFTLNAGQIVRFAVGQRGTDGPWHGGGGGATYVLIGSGATATLMLVAGGGGGASNCVGCTGAPGSGTNLAVAAANWSGTGNGTLDGGAVSNGSANAGGGGAGWASSGFSATHCGAHAVNGGTSPFSTSPVGGQTLANTGACTALFAPVGGFGGGGAGAGACCAGSGGGGGGYAGGHGGVAGTAGGGGGGSFVGASGANPFMQSGVNLDNGSVRLMKL